MNTFNTMINLDPLGILEELFNDNSRVFRNIQARAAGRFPPVNVYLDDNAVPLPPGGPCGTISSVLDEAIV